MNDEEYLYLCFDEPISTLVWDGYSWIPLEQPKPKDDIVIEVSL